MKKIGVTFIAVLICTAAWAKLPAPAQTDEAKAKAAEAAAKTAHGNKVANFQLCKSMDRAAAHYMKTAKGTGKEPKPAVEMPPCADPGAFVYPLPAVPAAGAPATVAAAPAITAPAAVAQAAAPAVKPAAAPVKK